jgi:hypothetical protein
MLLILQQEQISVDMNQFHNAKPFTNSVHYHINETDCNIPYENSLPIGNYAWESDRSTLSFHNFKHYLFH